MIIKESRRTTRAKRHTRIRGRVSGTAERPRLAVFRSSKHIYVQLIDDTHHRTLAAASSLDVAVKTQVNTGATVEAARAVGAAIAGKVKEAGFTAVVFDRGGNLYHGRVAALADAAREHGLEF